MSSVQDLSWALPCWLSLSVFCLPTPRLSGFLVPCVSGTMDNESIRVAGGCCCRRRAGGIPFPLEFTGPGLVVWRFDTFLGLPPFLPGGSH